LNAIMLRAHFDGEKIVLDDPVELEPNAEFIIAILPQEQFHEERAAWLRLSMEGLNRAYGDDEPEYTLDMIKEHNPDYEGR
jgi:hypothetical protein